VFRRTVRHAFAVCAAAAMTAVTIGPAAAGEPLPGVDAGPPYDFVTELMGEGVYISMKDVGFLGRTPHGYRFRTGQQDSHLVVTRVDGGLRFVDTGTRSFKRLSPLCQEKNVRVGIAAVCPMPASISVRWPLLVEVWPRLGNDFTDVSTLPATVAVTVLGDGGRDVAHFGAGPDFFNGHIGQDRIRGGAGNDWIRAGDGDDTVEGGPGNDDLVAMEGADVVHAGAGDDRVGGGDGDDRLWADAGADFVLCGIGRDRAMVEAADRVFHDCESVERP
jgi:serralysin